MFSSERFFQALCVKPTLLCQALGTLPVGSLAPPAVFGVQSRVVPTTWLAQLPAPTAGLALGIMAHFWEELAMAHSPGLSWTFPLLIHVSALSLVSFRDPRVSPFSCLRARLKQWQRWKVNRSTDTQPGHHTKNLKCTEPMLSSLPHSRELNFW